MTDFTVNARGLGERIRTLRLKQNKTQSYFADILYISPSYLALIEAGKRIPNLDVLIQIVRVTDVSLDYLVFGKDETLDSQQKAFDRLRAEYPPEEIQNALQMAEFYLQLTTHQNK